MTGGEDEYALLHTHRSEDGRKAGGGLGHVLTAALDDEGGLGHREQSPTLEGFADNEPDAIHVLSLRSALLSTRVRLGVTVTCFVAAIPLYTGRTFFLTPS